MTYTDDTADLIAQLSRITAWTDDWEDVADLMEEAFADAELVNAPVETILTIDEALCDWRKAIERLEYSVEHGLSWLTPESDQILDDARVHVDKLLITAAGVLSMREVA